MRFYFLVLAALLVQTVSRSQTTLYVDSSKTTSGAGTSWATAYKTLGEALNVANAGASATAYNVYVAKGTYYPTGVQSSTVRDSAFLMLRGGLRVYGGYPSGGGTRNITSNPTVLSGAIGIAADSTDNSYHVVVVANIASATDSTILDGFRVERAAATGGSFKSYNGTPVFNFQGGAGYVVLTSAKVLFKSCAFNNSFNGSVGAGLYVEDASPVVEACSFSRNNANGFNSLGGAIYNNNRTAGVLRMTGCTLSDNKAATGGAIFTRYPMQNLVVSNSSFINNKALNSVGSNGQGGGIYYDSASLSGDYLLQNLIFTGNTAAGGAGVYVANWGGTVLTSALRLSNCSFTANKGLETNDNGGGMCIYNNMRVQLDTCTFTANRGGNGGGVYTFGRLRVRGCTFTNDTAYYSGGALFSDGAHMSIDSSSFTGNRAIWDDGGAIYNQYDSLHLNKCTLESNSSVNGSGGAVAIYGWALYMKESIVRGNYAGVNGGGLALFGYEHLLRNSLFSGNRAAGTAGAVYVTDGHVALEGITMAGDSAATSRGFACTSCYSLTAVNSIIWDGTSGITWQSALTPSITYSTIQGGLTGTGNLSSNPLFVSPVAGSLAPTTAGNYALTGCSPAINAGLNNGSYTGITDVIATPRLVGLTVDQGAYEFPLSVVTGTITGISSLCPGTSSQLSSTVSGGTWSNPAPSLVTVSSTGQITAGATAGVDTVFYTVISGGCPLAIPKFITVLAPPSIAAITGGSSVCAGSTTLLSSTTAGGVWSSNNASAATVTASGLVAGIAAGTATIRYKVTNTNGCTDSVSQLVTVLALPAAPAITGGNTVCPGSTLQLSGTASGGTWGSSCTGGSLTINTTGLVSGTTPGSCTVQYTVTGANGCTASSNQGITVLPLPAAPAITGPSNVCIGIPASYTATPSGGAWTVANPAIASITSGGTLTGLAAGPTPLSYSYTAASGCTGTGTKSIVVNGQVANSVAASLCSGTSYNFGGQIITAPGTYNRTFVSAAGCDSVVTLTLSGLPAPDTTVIQSGSQLTALATGASYQWLRCEPNGTRTTLTGFTNASFTPLVSGSYAVTVNKGGCTATSGCRTVTGLGIEEHLKAGWTVYPNPATGLVTVSSSNVNVRTITVQDATGKQLMQVQATGVSTVLHLEDYPSGLYLITLTDSNGVRYTRQLSLVSGK